VTVCGRRQTGGGAVETLLSTIALPPWPERLDARVQLREVLPNQMAVIGYLGFWSESNDNEHLTTLPAALLISGIDQTGSVG